MATISVSDDVLELLDAKMRRGNFHSTDDLLRLALATLDEESDVETYEDLDDETRTAIEEAEAEYKAGLARPWDEVRAQLKAKFIDRSGQP